MRKETIGLGSGVWFSVLDGGQRVEAD